MFDLLFLLVVGLSTAFAVLRGGLQELSTLFALALAAGVAWLIAPPLLSATGLAGSFFASVFVAAALVGVFFLAAHIGFHIALKRVPMTAQHSRINRIGGGVFGLARGLVLIGLGYLGYSYYLDEAQQPDSVKNAITRPIAAGMAGLFEGFAPPSTDLAAGVKALEADTVDALEPSEDGYDRADRSSLDEIVTTVTTTDEEPAAPNEDDAGADGLTEDDIADILEKDDE